ncbi:MAG: hypothetical protein LBF26_00155, partial [Puniceicoccales bacterium]|nr:hypothetical protein [Puniceicoccales bacterium]
QLRGGIGGENEIAALEKLLEDIGCQSNVVGRQKVEENLQKIKQIKQGVAQQPAVPLQPKTQSGIWIISLVAGLENVIKSAVIRGRDDDDELEQNEITAFKAFLGHLLTLAEANPGDRFTADCIRDSVEIKRALADCRRGNGIYVGIYDKIHNAVCGKHPNGLINAVFAIDTDGW